MLCSNACKKQIYDIYGLQKFLIQTWFDFEFLTSGVTDGDHVCVLVANTLNTCCEIIIHLYYVVYQNIL